MQIKLGISGRSGNKCIAFWVVRYLLLPSSASEVFGSTKLSMEAHALKVAFH